MSPTKTTTRKRFTAEERAAMRERAKETKAGAADGETAVREAIAKMEGLDRQIAERLHALIAEVAPELAPRTWYGMPAYSQDGNVVCYFQNQSKFKARYATVGFSDKANLDDGAMWPTVYAVSELTPEVEKRLSGLITQAISRA